MIELFIGTLFGASSMVLFLHFTGRLAPRHPETYTGAPNVSVHSASTSLATMARS